MSGRNRGPPLPMKGGPHGGMPPIHEPPFGRNLGPMPHPALLEEMREAKFQMGHHRQIPPHPGIFEERLAVQHQDIQALLVDNQRLAATHVALKQELEAAQHELQQTDHFARNFLMEKDMQLRELYEKSAKMEHDLHGVEGMRAELMQVHADVKELTATRQKLTAQVQAMTQDLGRANADLQQVPALKSEIGGLRQELQHARAAIEHEKKGHAENYEHGQVMEKNLLTMARELEKLRAEMANAEKRARATAATVNPNPGYNPNYGNPEANYSGNPYPEANYAGNPYPANYGMSSTNQMNPVQPGVEAYPQYVPGPGSWGSYDMQRAQGHR
ncbi:FLX-like protein 1 [Tanacetum coccineum]